MADGCDNGQRLATLQALSALRGGGGGQRGRGSGGGTARTSKTTRTVCWTAEAAKQTARADPKPWACVVAWRP